MEELYVEVLCEPLDGYVSVPLETCITLFLVKYCQVPCVHLIFVVKPNRNPSFTVKIAGLKYELCNEEEVPKAARLCLMPVILTGEDTTCVAGLCAVLRQVVKSTLLNDPEHFSSSLLGFRQGCLMACAESSVWTRFCEVDMISTVKELVISDVFSNEIHIPNDVVRFEIHMSQPVRIHNAYKNRADQLKQGRKIFRHLRNVDFSTSNKVLEHCYAEGPVMTLADIILFPCFHIILESIKSVYLQQYIPLTMNWYQEVLNHDGVEEALCIIKDVQRKIVDDLYYKYTLSDLPKQSLYKSDPTRYKPKHRIYTRQEDVNASLQVVADIGLLFDWHTLPFGSEVQFDWRSLPYEAQPEGGHLPASRKERKSQQLENLTKAVLKVAQPGHTIVDFCSGSGHLGIVLAHLLPRCNVILLENKEESLSRARARIMKLKLSNVSFCQCNLDYFNGQFDIGTSLHACGVATDLVIQRCIQQRAIFISCPCCYGSVENNHVITYPRSQLFRNSPITLKDYLVLGHSADQTHDETNVKTDQGKKCMGIIDTDRCLQAMEAGYVVSLAKLIPESCTPKNNLLVGVPKEQCDLLKQY